PFDSVFAVYRDTATDSPEARAHCRLFHARRISAAPRRSRHPDDGAALVVVDSAIVSQRKEEAGRRLLQTPTRAAEGESPLSRRVTLAHPPALGAYDED